MDIIPKLSLLGSLAGWLTIAGLALIAFAYVRHVEGALNGPLALNLLCLGAVCSLLGGIPWAHTRGKRRLKTAFLGAVSFAGGGALGLLLGVEATSAGGDVGLHILAAFGGFWVGAILFGSFGVWWGNTFTRRFQTTQN
jgi:hypothetical protein